MATELTQRNEAGDETGSLRGDQRGAVYVEFLIAFMPLFTMFLGLVQIADLYQANIIVTHSAILTARVAAVVLPDDPKYYDSAPVNHFDGKRREAILNAAMTPLLASRSISEAKVTLPSTAGGKDSEKSFNQNSLIRAAVTAHFECRVPLVKHMVCGADKLMTLRAESAMPNQGAEYRY